MPLTHSESIIAAALAAVMVGRIEAMAQEPEVSLAHDLRTAGPTPAADETARRISSDRERDTVSIALNASWAESTRRDYKRGITAYLNWCSSKDVPAERRLPASESLLCEFGASLAGRYSGSAARNILSGVWAWHIFSGAPWEGSVCLQQVLHRVENLRPASSRKAAR